ncbi:Exodeoxyribonuclease VII large subunit [Caminicella sporogenes DSM 14501]|uniref:Exodeoxyribonuclease 7 large subunit n=1 Tax=Caminicella sporogenes DSM 14501 TaxID=1121266 RepID=A0A1M6LLI8_9FIRM|nr:exodeoxyribonuclease VII large subunit [Caminicella sporogenes]RKD28065.1 exodeoxyribonuclease VII large subunit [Caminicella sporogenes]SHJ72101.1 Exodeoxyribonuclease VII large subunit [Caminicella sporogenes DSM 14501]
MRIKILTVTELTNYLKRILLHDPILNNLVIKGEISNFKLHSSGHVYFSIKDEKSKLKCIMFSSEFVKLKFMPKDGMKVIVKGYISIYDKNGEYQLYVNELEEEGLGDLYIEFEKLKNRLFKKGYFDSKYKKKIPFFPKKIAVVTSPTGAAIRDIISVITRRNNFVDILISPVLVQGDRASVQISEAIDRLNKIDDVDLIILARGGGSIEELWPFNEEIVADSIFNSKKPIISAVGHETDFTISDFVADLRAPTPSAAGEIAVPTISDIKYTLNLYYRNLKVNISKFIENYKHKLENYSEERMQKYLLYKIREEHQNLDYMHSQISNILNKKVEILKEMLFHLGNNLNNLSPLSTMSRGFAILQSSDNKLLTSVENVNLRDEIKVLLRDGYLNCTVDNIEKGDKLIDR